MCPAINGEQTWGLKGEGACLRVQWASLLMLGKPELGKRILLTSNKTIDNGFQL